MRNYKLPEAVSRYILDTATMLMAECVKVKWHISEKDFGLLTTQLRASCDIEVYHEDIENAEIILSLCVISGRSKLYYCFVGDVFARPSYDQAIKVVILDDYFNIIGKVPIFTTTTWESEFVDQRNLCKKLMKALPLLLPDVKKEALKV